MSQTIVTPRTLASIGEEIPHELGARMIKDYQEKNPGKEIGNFIGREIIEEILAQPDCVGINFYNAINEVGRETLVYIGVDNSGEVITKYSTIDTTGRLVEKKGIVADRVLPPPDDKEWWEWLIELV